MKRFYYILLLAILPLFECCDHVFTFEGYSDSELGSATINDSTYYQIGSKYVFTPSVVTGLRSTDSLITYQVKLAPKGGDGYQTKDASYELRFYIHSDSTNKITDMNYKLEPVEGVANIVDNDYLTVPGKLVLSELKRCKVKGTAIIRERGKHFNSYGGNFRITEIYHDGLRCRGTYTLKGKDIKINGKFDANLE